MPGRECAEQFAKKFHKKIGDVYCEEALEDMAKQTEFKVRKSKLTPTMFVNTVVFKEVDNATDSLEDHSIAIKQHYGVSIKKQSLDERFDETAVNLIKALLKQQLANQISSVI